MWLERLYDEATTPHRTPSPGAFVGVALLALGVLLFVLVAVFAAITGQTSALAAFFAFLLLALGAVSIVGLPRRDANPSGRNPVCPKCGVPPGGSVTGNGFTRCGGCGNPYFVF